MRKEFRFLLQSARINLALVAGYAAVLTLGAILFPAPEGERNLFYNYFISAPITVSFILFIMSFRSVYKELHADHETGAADNK